MNPAIRSLARLQPDLLRVLQALAVVRVGLAVLFAAVMTFAARSFSFMSAVPLITASMLLALVWSSRMKAKLGARHIPVAILLMTVDALITSGHFPRAYIEGLMPSAERMFPIAPMTFLPESWLASIDIALSQGAPPFLPLIVLINLFVLLTMVCWLYPRRGALAYIAGTTLVDIILTLGLSAWSLQTLTLLTFIFARTVIFVILAVVITQLVSVQYKQQDSLLAANAKLTRYVSVVEELTISRERNRLARELHDTLAHTLSAASVQLEAANSLWQSDHNRSHKALAQATEITRNGLAETRRALKALRASPLDDLGLALALKELGDLTSQRSGAQVVVALPAQLEPLPAEVEQTLYRTAQEALENVVRHAHARHVELSLSQQGPTFHMLVRDDGAGFNVDSAQEHSERYGLSGMQERVTSLGGRMSITSAPGSGTCISLEITIHDDSHLAV